MTIFSFLLGLLLVVDVVLLILVTLLFQRRFGTSSQLKALEQLADQAKALHQNLSAQFASATADTAMRLEQTKGALGLQVADRLGEGFATIRSAVEDQMKAGRQEQFEARAELTSSLALTTAQLKSEFDSLNQKTAQSLDSIRDRVDARLMAITDQV